MLPRSWEVDIGSGAWRWPRVCCPDEKMASGSTGGHRTSDLARVLPCRAAPLARSRLCRPPPFAEAAPWCPPWPQPSRKAATFFKSGDAQGHNRRSHRRSPSSMSPPAQRRSSPPSNPRDAQGRRLVPSQRRIPPASLATICAPLMRRLRHLRLRPDVAPRPTERSCRRSRGERHHPSLRPPDAFAAVPACPAPPSLAPAASL